MTIKITTLRDNIAKLLAPDDAETLPLWASAGGDFKKSDGLSKPQRAWLKATGWRAAAATAGLLPGEKGLSGAVYAMADPHGGAMAALTPGMLPALLPEGDYHFATLPGDAQLACLAWLLGAYSFKRYLPGETRGLRRLRLPEGVDRERLLDFAQAIWLARDLINTPSNDMGPGDLEDAVREVAKHFGAKMEVIAGDDLLKEGFRLHHAVGRASERAPRLIDLRWSRGAKGVGDPLVTIIGKGICFDTGGLNIKTGNSMLLMKKDMGGAATALALAAIIMGQKLPLRLRVLIPAADNNIAGNAFRPGDIIKSRSGLTVEIGNTDAEGRLVLADALHYADEEKPDTVITFATLTGSARIALGPELPPFYTDDEALAAAIQSASMQVADPLWRMPFWHSYDSYLKSETADLVNASSNGFAGSVVAALFLKRFVNHARRYLHLDIYGWSPRPLPARPLGGEPQGARALFEVLQRELGGKR